MIIQNYINSYGNSFKVETGKNSKLAYGNLLKMD